MGKTNSKVQTADRQDGKEGQEPTPVAGDTLVKPEAARESPPVAGAQMDAAAPRPQAEAIALAQTSSTALNSIPPPQPRKGDPPPSDLGNDVRARRSKLVPQHLKNDLTRAQSSTDAGPPRVASGEITNSFRGSPPKTDIATITRNRKSSGSDDDDFLSEKSKADDVHDWCEEVEDNNGRPDTKYSKVQTIAMASYSSSSREGNSSAGVDKDGQDSRDDDDELQEDELYDWCTSTQEDPKIPESKQQHHKGDTSSDNFENPSTAHPRASSLSDGSSPSHELPPATVVVSGGKTSNKTKEEAGVLERDSTGVAISSTSPPSPHARNSLRSRLRPQTIFVPSAQPLGGPVIAPVPSIQAQPLVHPMSGQAPLIMAVSMNKTVIPKSGILPVTNAGRMVGAGPPVVGAPPQGISSLPNATLVPMRDPALAVQRQRGLSDKSITEAPQAGAVRPLELTTEEGASMVEPMALANAVSVNRSVPLGKNLGTPVRTQSTQVPGSLPPSQSSPKRPSPIPTTSNNNTGKHLSFQGQVAIPPGFVPPAIGIPNNFSTPFQGSPTNATPNVTLGGPIHPLAVAAAPSQPLVVTPDQSFRSVIPPNGDPLAIGFMLTEAKSHIRDTKVVKKKKVELPKGHLPHPTPKFGDWLSSRVMINNYIVLESLGKGSFAEVRLCKEKTSDKLFALKIIDRQNMKSSQLGKKQPKFEDIKREIEIMKQLNHKNVLRLYEVMDDPKVNKLYLVIEYMAHGDLLSLIKGSDAEGKFHPLRDDELWSLLLQVLEGLKYLHEKKIVHGDIKPQNLLVGDGGVVKIADFGISQTLFASKQKLTDVAGTPAFMSPEMCSGEEYSGQLADVWALGATVYMLKFGNPPFVASSILQLYYKIQNDPLEFPIGTIDPVLKDLLEGMLNKNPATRLTLEGVVGHKWLQQPPLDTSVTESYHSQNSVHTTGQEAAVSSDLPYEKDMTSQEVIHRSVKFLSMATQRSISKDKPSSEPNKEEDSDSCGEDTSDTDRQQSGRDKIVSVTMQDSPRLQELLSTLQVPKLDEPVDVVINRIADRSSFSRLECMEGLRNDTLGICFASSSIQGQRGTQEDRITILPHLGTLDDSAARAYLRAMGYFAVFDGHGGAFCSSFLAKQLHQYLVSHSTFATDMSTSIIEACLSADETICRELLATSEDCGSTATIAIVDARVPHRRRLIVGNVGDSRCIISRNGVAHCLTSDHRPTRADEHSRILEAGGWVANDRVNGVLAVSRAFGNLEFKNYGTGKPSILTAGAEVTEWDCTNEDEFFVIACDGLWDVFTPQEVINFIRSRIAKHKDVERVTAELVNEALRKFTADNVSVVLVFLDEKWYN